jgi:hypothetical protein
MFRNRFWLSLALTLPVVFWSDHIKTSWAIRRRCSRAPNGYRPPMDGKAAGEEGEVVYRREVEHRIETEYRDSGEGEYRKEVEYRKELEQRREGREV